MTPEKKTIINKITEEQTVNGIKSPSISNKKVQPLLHEIDQRVDWKKLINVIEDHFTKIEDALKGLQTEKFSPKN